MTNENFLVQPLFPYPLYVTDIKRDITKEELDFFKKQEENVFYQNEGGNRGSVNSYLLHEENLKILHDNIFEKVKHFFDNVIATSDDVKPYITQSWLNWNDTNQFHHRHFHYNSLYSGVYYINTIENDSITFSKENEGTICFANFKTNHLFNSSEWTVPVHQGMLIIFPSQLNHQVKMNNQNKTRISLAFNVFIKGTVGNKNQYSELNL